MKRILPFIYGTLLIAVGYSCESNKSTTLARIDQLTDSVKQIYAPDGRVALFKPEMSLVNGAWVLTGESDQKEAIALYEAELSELVMEFDGKIDLLPNESVGDLVYAQVNNSVSNLRSKNKHSSELASQATLGTMLKMLKRTDEWYLVQSPDQYIAWVDHGGVVLKTAAENAAWETSEKVIITKNMTYAFNSMEKVDVISDVVLGNVLELVATIGNEFKVKFPDGRIGFVSQNDAELFSIWEAKLVASGELVETYARSMMGLPYLWGGTSTKGADCSGFTKTVYFMNGMVIPRDASQQVNEGVEVDPDLKFEGLLKGDLMFFGKSATDSTRRRVTHVAIWLGNGDFIHASQQVRMSSIEPNVSYFDEFNTNRYLGSRRYLLVDESDSTRL